MSRLRFFLLLGAAVAVLACALYLASLRQLPRDTAGMRLLPGFAAELATVSQIDVRQGAGAAAVTLHKTGDRWTVAQRQDYPADVGKIRRLLLALGDATLVEEKTANPANYAMIGVADPDAASAPAAAAGADPAPPAAAGTEVTVTARDGRHSVIIGRPMGNGNFARRPPQAQSYLIEPSIPVEADPRRWIEASIVAVPVRDIERLQVDPAAGPGYAIHRLSPPADGFALDAVPPHREPLDAKALAPSSSDWDLAADDVAPAATAATGTKPSLATLTLAGGATIKLIGTTGGDKHWLQVQNGRDAALTARTNGRAFEIAGYRYDAIFRPLEQLLKPLEPRRADVSHKPKS